MWIDYFKGTFTKQTETLDGLLDHKPLAIGDLILTEVLQGFTDERDFNKARKMLTSLIVVELGGQEIAIQAAKNLRALRELGVTVRKTMPAWRVRHIWSSWLRQRRLFFWSAPPTMSWPPTPTIPCLGRPPSPHRATTYPCERSSFTAWDSDYRETRWAAVRPCNPGSSTPPA